ncbi:MAG: S8 family serine peptidase [Anaerolineae bacterium]
MKRLTKSRRIVAALTMLLSVGTTVGAGPSSPLNQSEQPVEILVQPATGVSIETIRDRYATPVLGKIPAVGIYKLAGSSASLEAMRNDPAVAQVARNGLSQPLEMQRRDFGSGSSYLLPSSSSAVNTSYYEQWPLIRLRVAQAQRLVSGDGVTVAIVDTGIDLDHPALADRLTAGYDFVEKDAIPDDGTDGLDNDGDGFVDEGAGHGTHVAGIVTLVAPEASLMPIRVLNSEGIGSYFDIVAGIVYAAEHGAHVINLSLSGPEDASFLQAAVDYAWEKGALVVAAAGAYDVTYPARYEHVISVGAPDPQDQVAEFSDFRAGQVTVFAPGVAIYSTYYDGGYVWWTGTSMAAPFVSGEAALLLSGQGCDRGCATLLIQKSVHPVVPNLELRGRVDVYQAVKAVANQ